MEKFNCIKRMGNSILLDFNDITTIDLSSSETLINLFNHLLEEIYQNLKPSHIIIKSDNGFQLSYLLDCGSSLIISTWTTEKTLTLNYYDTNTDAFKNIKKFEELICNALGWYNCTSNMQIGRGDKCKLFCNESENKGEILYNAKLIYREMTPFQELRVYDTLSMGRILLLDDMIQITQEMVDNYTIDMVQGVVNKESGKIYDHILIIGGGDMLIANYLLMNFADIVNKITICEIDERVIQVVKQFFFDSSIVNQSIENGKLQIVYQDGSLYAKELSEQNQKVDGIIIDCTDFLPEGGVANSLFTEEFYINIKSCMKVGSFFSQQLSYNEMIPISKAKWEKIGLNQYHIIMSETPEYSENLPIAYVQRSE